MLSGKFKLDAPPDDQDYRSTSPRFQGEAFEANLALVRAREGDTDGAYSLIAEALRIHPEDPYYIATRGEVHWHAGDSVASLNDFQAALEMLPPDATEAREEVMHWILRVE